LMTMDHLTPEQKQGSEIFFGDNRGWGLGLSVFTKRDNLCDVPGRFGWDGGYGTSWYSDPREGLTGVLLTQRMMDSPQPPPALADFWTLAYQAIDD
jgi:CubicO group peptidase (beta-lactamase class C family)